MSTAAVTAGAISAATTNDRVRPPCSPAVNTSSMTMPTAARFGWNTIRHASSGGTTMTSTPSGKRRRATSGSAVTKASTPMTGVRPVTLCSSSGSTSSATKAITARTWSMSGARSSPCSPSLPPAATRVVTARNASTSSSSRRFPSYGGTFSLPSAARVHSGRSPALELLLKNYGGSGRRRSCSRPNGHRGRYSGRTAGLTSKGPDGRRSAGCSALMLAEVPGRRGSAEEVVMRSLARWCVRHRLAVLGIWLMVLAGAFLGQSALGSHYATGTTLSGTPSAAAASLLQRAVPGQSGDTEQIVFQAWSGTVSAPAVRKQIQAMLGRVSHLRYVSGVTSPYTPAGAKQISASRHVAFATVNFSKDASNISAAEAARFVKLARAPNSPTLQVDVVGAVAASTNPASSSSTLIGVLAALVILLVFFGAVLPALLPLISTGIALTAGLGVVAMLSHPVTMASFTSQLCTLIGLGVGIDYSLFILTRARTGLRRGLSVEEAVAAAAATAGRAVLFAGITVCIALLGILTVGVSTLSGAAIGASIAVAFPVGAALARGETGFAEASRGWTRWASTVQGHKIILGVGALGIMLALGAPFLSMRQGTADYSVDPTSTTTTTYRGYEMLVHGFGPGFSGPLQLVAPLHSQADRATFGTVVTAASHAPGVVTTAGPTYFPAGPGHPAVALAEVYPAGSPQAVSTS